MGWTNQEVGDNAARALVEYALGLRSMDNISVIVLMLNSSPVPVPVVDVSSAGI
jgi:hypothetical protein